VLPLYIDVVKILLDKKANTEAKDRIYF
jgi:hypothetical protein